MSVGRKDALIRKAGNVGRRWTRVQRPTPEILLSHDSFQKEEWGGVWGGKNLSESSRQEVGGGLHHSPLSADWLTLSSDVISPCNLPAGLLSGLLADRELVIFELLNSLSLLLFI